MKIICVGRNYVDHIKELSNDKPTDPVIFLKPDTALLEDSKFYYPSFSNDVHYELELVFKIGKVGKNIEAKFCNYNKTVIVNVFLTPIISANINSFCYSYCSGLEVE